MKKTMILLLISLVTAFIMIFNAFAGSLLSTQRIESSGAFDICLIGFAENLQKLTSELRKKPKPKEPSFIELPVVKEIDDFATALCELRDIVYNPAVEKILEESRSTRDMYNKVKEASNRFCTMFEDLKAFIVDVETEVVPRAQAVTQRFECLSKSDVQLNKDTKCKALGCYDRRSCIAETLRETHRFLRPFIDHLFARQVVDKDGNLAFNQKGEPIMDEGALLHLMHFDEFIPTFVKRELEQKMPHIDSLLKAVVQANQKLLIPLIIYVIVPLFDLLPALSVAINPPTLQKLSDDIKAKIPKIPPVTIPNMDDLLNELLVEEKD